MSSSAPLPGVRSLSGSVADHFNAPPPDVINLTLGTLLYSTLLSSSSFNLRLEDLSRMSSYDPIPPEGIISQEQFRASMKLVRLQIAVPISVLASIAANIVCALAIKPGLRESSHTSSFTLYRNWWLVIGRMS